MKNAGSKPCDPPGPGEHPVYTVTATSAPGQEGESRGSAAAASARGVPVAWSRSSTTERRVRCRGRRRVRRGGQVGVCLRFLR